MKNFREGEVLLIHKPLHWTSFQVVNKLKYLIRSFEYRNANESTQNSVDSSINSTAKISKFKIGHAGTLDPLATGLLIVCTGKQTKNIENYQAQEKEYTGTFYLGATTPCFDLEKEIDFKYDTSHITDEDIHNTSLKFIGIQEQTPPLFSAIKIVRRM